MGIVGISWSKIHMLIWSCKLLLSASIKEKKNNYAENKFLLLFRPTCVIDRETCQPFELMISWIILAIKMSSCPAGMQCWAPLTKGVRVWHGDPALALIWLSKFYLLKHHSVMWTCYLAGEWVTKGPEIFFLLLLFSWTSPGCLGLLQRYAKKE